MKILVIGAGATGGYFGGRLLAAGKDVTFLVRARRAAQLADAGLVIKSPRGDLHLEHPPVVQAGALDETYDLVLLSCKAYDLDEAMASFAPAVGPRTLILPLLNGMGHVDLLAEKFGAEAVLGGQCLISSTLDDEGRIIHLNDIHSLTFGARDGARATQVADIMREFSNAGFDAALSDDIVQDMWEKWVFIATAAGMTCLMRASIGDIIAAGGGDLSERLLGECATVAAGQGFAPRPAAMARSLAMFKAAGSPMTASMLRDVEAGGRTEYQHILGDLMRRGGLQDDASSVLRTAFIHLGAYEARRAKQNQAR
jgi:2-dehydropantoate 2-reductase